MMQFMQIKKRQRNKAPKHNTCITEYLNKCMKMKMNPAFINWQALETADALYCIRADIVLLQYYIVYHTIP